MTLPEHGDLGWDTPLNNAVQAISADAAAAKADALAARNDAAYAKQAVDTVGIDDLASALSDAETAADTATTNASVATGAASSAQSYATQASTARSAAEDARDAAEAARTDLLSQKGAASGVAPLDSGSRVPQGNLPAHLDPTALTASTTDIVNTLVPDATSLVKGKIRIATLTEVATGTVADRAVAPDTLLAVAGRAAQSTDRIVYVSQSAKAKDTNDGLSPGAAKATIAAAIAALPSSGGVVFLMYGTWDLGSGSVGLTIGAGKPVFLMGLAQRGFTELTYSGTGTAVKIGDGRMVTDLAVSNGSTTITSATANFTSADVGRVPFAQFISPDATITAVTNATTATISSAATGTATGLTAWFSTRSEPLAWLKYLQITCTHPSAATTGILMTDVHGGFMEDVRVLGNSYNSGSIGIRSVDGYVFSYSRLLVQSFERGLFLDGFCNDVSIDNCQFGAKISCVDVKDSSDVRIRGGQYSTTGTGNGGAGIRAWVTGFGNAGGDPAGAGSGLVIDEVHFESNGNGLDVAIGRSVDGSTYPVRSPKIHCRLPSGGTIDRATNPTLHNVTLFGSGFLTLTANCTDPVFVGEPSLRDSAIISDSSTRTRPRERDVQDILSARVPLYPWLAGDAFARADAAGSLGTSDSGHAWTNTIGSFSLVGKAAVPAASGFNIASLDLGSAEHWVTVEIGTNPATIAQWLIARLVDSSNYYRVALFPTTVDLFKVVGGTATNILSIAQTPAAGDSLGLRCTGSSLSVYRNGFLIGRVTDSSVSGTRAGFQASATTGLFRKFRARTP